MICVCVSKFTYQQGWALPDQRIGNREEVSALSFPREVGGGLDCTIFGNQQKSYSICGGAASVGKIVGSSTLQLGLRKCDPCHRLGK